MEKYRVSFKFDNENSTSTIIEAENREMLYRSIVSQEDWYTYEDSRGVFRAINMKLVTSIKIEEYKKSTITRF